MTPRSSKSQVRSMLIAIASTENTMTSTGFLSAENRSVSTLRTAGATVAGTYSAANDSGAALR